MGNFTPPPKKQTKTNLFQKCKWITKIAPTKGMIATPTKKSTNKCVNLAHYLTKHQKIYTTVGCTVVPSYISDLGYVS